MEDSHRKDGKTEHLRLCRHVMLSTGRGLITEVERTNVPCSDESPYILRYHRLCDPAPHTIVIDGSGGQPFWVGFRYHGPHWSFIGRNSPQGES